MSNSDSAGRKVLDEEIVEWVRAWYESTGGLPDDADFLAVWGMTTIEAVRVVWESGTAGDRYAELLRRCIQELP